MVCFITVFFFKWIVRNKRSDFVFFSEINMLIYEVVLKFNCFHFDYADGFYFSGFSGGFIFLWNSSFNVQFISKYCNFLVCNVSVNGIMEWSSIFVYGD